MIDEKKKKTIIVLAVVAIVIVVAFAVVQIIIGRTAQLRVSVAPISSTVEIDGKIYENGTYQIREGKHVATISKEGFETQKIEFTARADEGCSVETYLIQNDGGEDWYASHPEDDELRWFISESISQKKLDDFYKNNPILNALPIKVGYYSKNYSSYVNYEISAKINSDYTAFEININDYTGGNRENALGKIREAGFNPDDYTINYHDQAQGWGKAPDDF
ncbi:MAG: hypothetical protein Q4A33_02935 [Candidatus Saccharibacteria bacterium]|nr:hypothetical protein [Candidatus Saccharibacteria bacterium]